ncbi:serine-threonine protein kinase [Mycolicibacterium sp. XJ870]
MTDSWPLVFDAEGDPDDATLTQLLDRAAGLTDLVIFSHGWNNDEAAATSLYKRWFDLLAGQLDPARKVGFVGLRWPSQLWRDEPIPDFEDAPDGVGGAAALGEARVVEAGDPSLDPAELAELKELFPRGSAQLDAIAELLAAPPSIDRVSDLFEALQDFDAATPDGFNDGEVATSDEGPGMVADDQDPAELFNTFADQLLAAGVQFSADGEDGAAGLGDFAGKLWHGAKEAVRQLSYWKMKNRAGVVGKDGLGPVIDQLAAKFPGLRIHLVGHSFGARVVSYALAGMTAANPSPVKSVTLLQGAYSRFAFTEKLPFRKGSGALFGMLDRLDGPLTVCFSSHDRALSTFYPLASAAAGDDSAAAEDPFFRWRAMGSHGAFDSPTHSLGPDGAAYPFQQGRILSLDASGVVDLDDGPSGAHSDIFHRELSWVVAAAGRLNK